ncbi:cytochrome c oxidase assembly protein [Citreimonas sp.]|uniref:cytochrome c oxidase assembly protein n=1 Tax=Citreimonas sp. TaxID=3036715 RepID=UPI0035C7C2C2
MDPYIPFCGTPPVPAELWSRWTLDPALLLGLAVALAVGMRVAHDRRLMAAGWALAALLFVSPLCALSMALFSARVAQHILLTLVAAPVIAAALPRLRLPALPMAGLFAVLFWGWHAPAPYAATLQSDLTYWAMHLSLTGSAVALFAALRAAPERGLAAAGLTATQLTLYAVMVTLAPEPWHAWHEVHAIAFGLSGLADQQLAGALMWVAGGAVFMALVGWLAWHFLRDDPRPRPAG